MPAHGLQLKVGMPVILLRNLNPAAGLANGTRLAIRHLGQHIIGADILTGSPNHIGSTVYLPKVSLSSNEGDLPFRLTR